MKLTIVNQKIQKYVSQSRTRFHHYRQQMLKKKVLVKKIEYFLKNSQNENTELKEK